MTDVTRNAREKTALSWRPYQVYLLAIILLVTIFHYLDRFIFGVVQEQIKHDLVLTDFQLGLLGGPAFALFYSFIGIPVARLAERINRVGLLAVCLAFWSTATAICGAAQNFVQLAFARFGVGGGEGGCIPVTHSLISDNFSARQRGIALSVTSAAAPIASISTPLIGGIIAQEYGWRVAFAALGVPGLLLALLVWFTIREPRKEKDAPPPVAKSSFLADAAWLFRNRAFVFLFLSAAFTGIGANGILLFEVSFLIRSFNLTLVEAAGIKSIIGGAALVGTFIGGVAADRFADDRGRSYVLVPAVGAVLACFFYVAAYSQASWSIALPLLICASLTYSFKNGPTFAAVQNIVPVHMRATGAAVFMVAATVMGSMLGPPLAGWVSDFFASREFGQALGSFADMCPGGKAAVGAAPEIAAACKQALADGLRGALIVISSFFAAAALLLFLSSRTIRMGAPDAA